MVSSEIKNNIEEVNSLNTAIVHMKSDGDTVKINGEMEKIDVTLEKIERDLNEQNNLNIQLNSQKRSLKKEGERVEWTNAVRGVHNKHKIFTTEEISNACIVANQTTQMSDSVSGIPINRNLLLEYFSIQSMLYQNYTVFNTCSIYNLNYATLPFEEYKLEQKNGEIVMLEINKKKGILKAQFKIRNSEEGHCTLTISVKNKHQVYYKNKMDAMINEIKQTHIKITKLELEKKLLIDKRKILQSTPDKKSIEKLELRRDLLIRKITPHMNLCEKLFTNEIKSSNPSLEIEIFITNFRTYVFNLPDYKNELVLAGKEAFDVGKNIYLKGKYSDAMKSFQKAIAYSFPYPPAYLYLGEMYKHGEAVCRNEIKSNEYYQEAGKYFTWFYTQAELENAQAQFHLAVCYENAAGVEKNDQLTTKYYLKSAQQNDTIAQYALALNYYLGVGTTKNQSEALRWQKLAAAKGMPSAQIWLGSYARRVAHDQKEAVTWYRKAAVQEHSDAQFFLGMCFMEGAGVRKDYNEAVFWYRKAANQGHADAQLQLTNCGAAVSQGVGKGDQKEAPGYRKRKAAEQGPGHANKVIKIEPSLVNNLFSTFTNSISQSQTSENQKDSNSFTLGNSTSSSSQ